MSAADGLGPLPVGAVYTRALGSVGAAMYTYTADQVITIRAEAVAAERKRLAAEFTKRAEALNTTGAGCAPHIQAQYEAMAGELLDWAATLG